MTDLEFEQLSKRVVNGKAWVEKLKADGAYHNKVNQQHLRLWFKLGDLLLAEEQKRNVKPKGKGHKGLMWFGRNWHSKAWVAMRTREKTEDDKREKARIRRAELADEKRRGLR